MAVAVSFSAGAIQPDAPFLTAQKKNAAKWAAEDKSIDARLAALRKRFGKTPNIIYILADDVGWGELGWPGGHGGLPNMDFYNVRRDPGEKRGEFYPGLYAVTPLQNTLKSHMFMIRKFPHRTSKTMPRGAEVTAHD